MKYIDVRNVNDAYREGVKLFRLAGEDAYSIVKRMESRNCKLSQISSEISTPNKFC